MNCINKSQLAHKMLSKNIQSKKPFCKVCQDAGKPENVYTSHWVKDLTGKTTCPTLLNTECRFCHKLGHTTKFCKELNKENARVEKEKQKQQEKPKKNPIEQPKKPKNTFAVLCDDSDSCESDNENVCLNEIEVRIQKTIEVAVPTTNSWANIASKPKEQKPVELPAKKTGLVLLSDFVKKEEEHKPLKVAPWAQQAAKKSWADLSDSEDEDDLPEVQFEVEDDTW